MPSDVLAAARVFQIPGPAGPTGPTGPRPAEDLTQAEGTIFPERALLPEPGAAGAGAAVSPEGTLLAVVPIPGTDSSLAIVGYRVPAAAAHDTDAGPHRPQSPDGGLVVDHARRCVWLSGAEVQLTYQEFELLAFLSANPAHVFSRADLLSQVWGQTGKSRTRTVDVHVSRLRRKLGPAYGPCLATEHRVGYRFDPLSVSAAGPDRLTVAG